MGNGGVECQFNLYIFYFVNLMRHWMTNFRPYKVLSQCRFLDASSWICWCDIYVCMVYCSHLLKCKMKEDPLVWMKGEMAEILNSLYFALICYD